MIPPRKQQMNKGPMPGPGPASRRRLLLRGFTFSMLSAEFFARYQLSPWLEARKAGHTGPIEGEKHCRRMARDMNASRRTARRPVPHVIPAPRAHEHTTVGRRRHIVDAGGPRCRQRPGLHRCAILCPQQVRPQAAQVGAR